MKNKRRHIFYIDKIFQKKLMLLFLGINIAVAAANVLYYFIHLKGAVEENMFRSHIVIDNVGDAVAGDVLRFNLLLAAACLVLVLLFYSMTRFKLKTFFDKIKRTLISRQCKTETHPTHFKIAREFQDIHRVLGDFIQLVDSQRTEQENRIRRIKEKLG